MKRLLLFALLLAWACFPRPHVLEGRPCDPAGMCPPGLVCFEGVCLAPAHVEYDGSLADDSGLTPVDGGTDGGSDAGPSDGGDAGSVDSGSVDGGVDGGPGETRDPFLWPFSKNSFWNMPIGSAAVYVDAGLPALSNLTIREALFLENDLAHPQVAVLELATYPLTTCSGGTQKLQIAIPSALTVPLGEDIGALFFRDAGSVRHLFPVARCSQGGPLVGGWISGDVQVTGDGYLDQSGGHGGSGMSGFGGAIRKGEFTGTSAIRHALKIEVSRSLLSKVDGGYRWPAANADTGYASNYTGSNPALRMGSLLAIPPSVDLGAIAWQTDAGRKVAWTLQNFGVYVVNTASSGSYTFDVEVGVPQEFQTAYSYAIDAPGTAWLGDFMTAVQLLSIVDDNGPSTPGGVGTRLQPLAPDFR